MGKELNNKNYSDYLNKKICKVCQIYQTAKIKHCYDCGNCIMQHNYHANLFNNCIGKRNNFYYMIYFISLLIFIINTGIGIVIYVIEQNDLDYNRTYQSKKKHSNGEKLIEVFLVCLLLPVGVLCAINIYQIFGKIINKYRFSYNRFSWLGKLKYK